MVLAQERFAGCSKRLSSKAAASEEARRTLRYVEPLSDARTKLAGFFSILLGDAAFRTMGRFFCCLTLFGGQRKELFALPAGANFEVGRSLIVDVGRQDQLQRVISDRAAVRVFD